MEAMTSSRRIGVAKGLFTVPDDTEPAVDARSSHGAPMALDQLLEQLQAIKAQHGGGAGVVVDTGDQHFPLEVTSVSYEKFGVSPTPRVVLRDDARRNGRDFTGMQALSDDFERSKD